MIFLHMLLKSNQTEKPLKRTQCIQCEMAI